MHYRYLFTLLMFACISGVAYAQTGTIRGTVTTADGQPAEFVHVALKGTTKGSSTDKAGKFEIRNIQPGTYTLYASLVGANAQEQSVSVTSNAVTEVSFSLNESFQELSEVTVYDSRINRFYNDSSFAVAKLPLNDLENPQVYNSISRKVMMEQVVTNLNDALKNATGITRLWESTGRGGDGAEYYAMRGFALQPNLVNGMPAISNGGLDPVNVESIEVIKGPSGTLYGSPLISYGGLINITTKRPFETFAGDVGLITGSNGLTRLTADVNIPLNEKTFARINTAFHTENSFQDAGFTKSFFIAPSFLIKSSERLTFHINTEFLSKESANAPMVFLNRSNPLSFSEISTFQNHYQTSFTSNDLSIRNPSFGLQAQAMYKISDNWTSQTILSKSNTKTDGYYHYLWDFSDGDTFGRYISRRNGETITTDFQQNFIGDFNLGNLRNRMIIGFDFFRSNILNGSTGWRLNGQVTLSDGEDTGILTRAGVDNILADSFEGNSEAESKVISAYISDVINITPALSVMASVRLDQFSGSTAYWSTDEVKSQTTVSPKFGVVYQPIKDQVSIFANYMNGFINVAPQAVFDGGGNQQGMRTFDPERANQMEVGVKANTLNKKLTFSASYYNIQVGNRVMTDPENLNNFIQGGEVESKGFEISTIANPVKGWNIIAGYSKNESEVTVDYPAAGYLGMRPEEAGPEQLINYWTSYTLQHGILKGFGIGFGGISASEHKTLNRDNIGTFTLPAYHVMNASLSYMSRNYAVILKVNNLTDKQYFSGWSTVTPQNLRNISVSLNYRF
ncbi:MAG: TonB-dependent receptor [Cyclobacteriaceae bacterium]|nr:MAG: TonB-dependent receptor [Cyclobacteriaceae bacterium]